MLLRHTPYVCLLLHLCIHIISISISIYRPQVMTGSPFIDKGKYEGKPIYIFQSSLSNSIIVDNCDKNSLRVGTISMSTTNRHQDTTTLNSTNGTCTEGMLRSDSIDDEIHRPSNEYVLVRSPSVDVCSRYEFNTDSTISSTPSPSRVSFSTERRLLFLFGLHGVSSRLCHYCQLPKHVG